MNLLILVLKIMIYIIYLSIFVFLLSLRLIFVCLLEKRKVMRSLPQISQ